MINKLRILAIMLIIIAIVMIVTGVMIEISNDYVCSNTTNIKWFIENCEIGY